MSATAVSPAPGTVPPLDADSTLAYVDPAPQRVFKRTVALAGLGVYLAYLVYRGLFTLNPGAPVFSGLVYFAEVHFFLSLAFYYHQGWALRRRNPPAAPPGLRVDVFITTDNEDIDLLRQTVRGAVAMRYPHRTFVLDDGRRKSVRALAEELGAGYIARGDNVHGKAGNWNNAFRHTDADLIATFDADHVPRAEFLERTLGFFRDPRIALVQVPQRHHNIDSVQHRVNWTTRRLYGQQDVFFNLVMPGKDHCNAAFFCGTGAVLRRAALAPHGGIVTGTITEDLHTSIVLHSEGWKSVYLNEVLVTALAPADFKSFDGQRLRWAEGTLKTAAHINPLTCRGLSLGQRINYVASLYHWTIGLPKLIFYLAPPWMLFTRTFPIATFDAHFLAVYGLFLATLLGSYHVMSAGSGWLLMDELFDMASVFTMLRALKRAVFGRGAGTYFVTSRRGGQTSGAEVIPHLGLLGFGVLALAWSWMGLGFGITDDWFGAAIASSWTICNMALVWHVLRLALRPPLKRRTARFRVSFPVELDEEDRLGVTGDLSEGGCTLFWPERLPRGRRLGVQLHACGQPIRLQADVVAHHKTRSGWAVHGLRFVGISQREVDALNDAIIQFVVPTLFERLPGPNWIERVRRRLSASRAHRRTGPRRDQALPVRVSDDAGTIVAVTRDTSEGGLGFVSPRPIARGTALVADVEGPRGCRRLHLRAAWCQPLPTGDGFPAWLVGAHVDRMAVLARYRDLEEETVSHAA